MNGKYAFLAFGILVLLWSMFWQFALRMLALRFPDSPASRGLLLHV